MKSSSILLFIAILGLLICFKPEAMQAQPPSDNNGNFGIGAMLGEPTGVSIKSWLSNKTAFDIGAAWSLGEPEALHMHADFLLHSWFENTGQLAFYYGIGARVIFSDDAEAGIRAPLGLNYVFQEIPFDLFIEAAPILDVSPDVELAGNGAVGIRYYL